MLNPQTVQVLNNLMVFFSRTDGRDKLVKFLQNFCRYKKYYSVGETSTQWKAVQSSLSEFRSLIKFGKPFKNIVEANALVTANSIRTFTFIGYLKLFSLISDIGYKIGDNIEYLSHYKFLTFNETRCEAWSKTFQWYAYFCDVVTGWFDIVKLQRKNFQTPEKYQEKRRRMLLYWSGDVADFFRVTPGFLKMYGLMNKHDGFSGVMGVWVGIMGCYKVWNKITKVKDGKTV